MKKKAFTLVELIIVIAIAFVILALFLPLVENDQRTHGFFVLVAVVVGVAVVAGLVIFYCDLEGNAVVCTIALTIIVEIIVCVVGYQKLKPNLGDGVVKDISWTYEIVIEERYYSDGEWHTREARRVTTSGRGKSPYWGEYTLGSREKVGRKIEKYYISILNSDHVFEDYQIEKELWEGIEIGDSIEFEYQKLDNYIYNLY